MKFRWINLCYYVDKSDGCHQITGSPDATSKSELPPSLATAVLQSDCAGCEQCTSQVGHMEQMFQSNQALLLWSFY